MSIADYLRPEAVITELAGKTREAALAELYQVISPTVDPEVLLSALIEERSAARPDSAKESPSRTPGSPVCRGWSPARALHRGIDFVAIDGKPTHFFLAVVTPETDAGARMVGVQVSGAT
jgi:hypothetical protein